MAYIGSEQMIVRIGRGMAASRLFFVCLIWGALLVAAKVACASGPALLLWDDAIIDNKYDAAKSESIQFVYTNEQLKPGDKIVPLIPMDPGFTVLCCVEVVSEKPYTLDELKAAYPDSISFVRRLRSLQGVRFAYQAKFVSEKEMSPAMRRISKGSGDTYYSAPALLGTTTLRTLDGNTFNWPDWGKVTLVFRNSQKGIEEYRLSFKNGASTIRVESLPD